MSKINNKEIKEAFNILRDENNIEVLYNKYNITVYGIAFSITKNNEEAEDIMQRVFVKIYELDKDKLPLNKEASWLYTLTRNETIDVLRKNKISYDIENYEVEDENNEIAKIIDIEYYNKIISHLNKEDKEIVSLKILSNLSFDEIAKLLNKPSGTIKWKYYKAISSLKLTIQTLAISIIAFILGLKPIKKEEGSLNFTEENIPISSISNQNIDYLSIILYVVSAVFFIIAINFLIIFIKNQLKLKNKTSK